ncbi:MAG: SIS domain-containing protein [Cellvibrionales bacterium]|nr:SIS domain-containing protein [Cellvibrionales bacterium]
MDSSLKPDETLMYKEAKEASVVVNRQLVSNHALIKNVAKAIQVLRKNGRPLVVLTCARGSSDHAASFAKYVFESQLGVIVSSVSPSIHSVYQSKQHLAGVLFLCISQSGKSPDLLTSAEQAKLSGALVVSLVNDTQSPLAKLSNWVVPLQAGAEKSVAATKSFIASLSAILHLTSQLAKSKTLNKALSLLPEQLDKAWQLDWERAESTLVKSHNLLVVGRGFGLAIAQEAALKFKETCGIHAEAFSGAEVKHGPMTLVQKHFPVFMLGQDDETLKGLNAIASEFSARDARIYAAMRGGNESWRLPTIQAEPMIEPLLLIQRFYKLVNAVAIRRGMNPDAPPYLNKVTETH